MMFAIMFIGCLCSLINAQLNLYQTERLNPLEFDCLYFYLGDDQFMGPQFLFPTYQRISYCRRPSERIDDEIGQQTLNISQMYTFEQLDQWGIATDQLLSWSASVYQAERYALYRSRSDLNRSLALEEFRNCSPSWFGSHCEYSFRMGSNATLANVVLTTFERKSGSSSSPYTLTNLTCYPLLECRRAEPFCLDWREICNGRIDCEDGGADEEHCWQLEINRCGPDEYRCHNGMCIPKDFFADDPNNPDCLDRTDESVNTNDFDGCFEDPTFRCEEHVCHPSFGSFPCGDGDCRHSGQTCKNQRHKLIDDAALVRGPLSDKCWTVMTCLAKIDPRKPPGEKRCKELFSDSIDIRSYLKDCEKIFQFPVHSLVHGHVRFIFFNNRTDGYLKNFFVPNQICYDRQLCDTIRPSFTDENLSCIGWKEFVGTRAITEYIDLINYTANYFKTCSSMVFLPQERTTELYRCRSSSKLIAKNRLLDQVQDCPMNDDENYDQTCSLDDPSRFSCNELTNKCYASIVDRQICRDQPKDNYTKLFFQNFCDGQDHLLRETIDGFTHTDETNCTDWPCNNFYARCDAHPHCSNREDEWNCVKSDCPLGFHPCVSPINYTLICLPSHRFHDGQPDCLGASDEPKLCLSNTSRTEVTLTYRCWNQSKCINTFDICNTKQLCKTDVDMKFCVNRSNTCAYRPSNSTEEHNGSICRLLSDKPRRKIYFSSENVTAILPTRESKKNQTGVIQNVQIADGQWPWRCNRGLYVRFQSPGRNESYRCFCPPSYYGNSCQFQSERVSLTIEILTVNRRSTYSFIVRLVDNASQSVSYEQFSMMGVWGCDRSFNMYLMYPDRAKDRHNNYSIQIEVFDRSTLTYWASWYVPIPFQFLPVNRLAVQLQVPGRSIMSTEKCHIDGRTGAMCCPFSNHPQTFCRSAFNCTGCSADSLCVGVLHGRPICVCPMHKAGLRCILDASCPSDRCSNHGECILLGHTSTGNNYICACNEQYYGPRCELMKTLVHIDLEVIETSTFILAHHVNLYAEAEPNTTIRIQKLYRDQPSVTFSLVEPIHLIFVQINQHVYLTHVNPISNGSASELHGRLSQCPHINTLINEDLLILPAVRLIKQYHRFCANFSHLSCFIDDFYTCLCTSERHANCLHLEPFSNLTCQRKDHCENGGVCYQDAPLCPSQTLCLCPHCYFGSRCQFYAKGFGVTLDDILRYEFRRHAPLSGQKVSVKISAILTGLMFVMGSISSLLSFLTFRRRNVRKVGCGLYLFTVSITSFVTVLLLTIKFWFLIASHLDLIRSEKFLRSGCIAIEPLLKIIFNVDNWLKACVAIERSLTIFQGIYFNKAASKRVARWIILILPVIIAGTSTHEFIFRKLINDEEGFYQHWCITNYPSTSWKNYNTVILIGHFFVPFVVNLTSTIFIIVSLARQQLLLRQKYRYRTYLRQQFNEHKQTLISPIILVLLSSPRLIISLMSSCIDSSHDPRWSLFAYFISFIPSVLTFVVFVLSSNFYQTEFRKHFTHFSNSS